MRVQEDERDRYYNQLAGSSLHRLAGLSDGIFAVAMTILVLALAVPAVNEGRTESELGQAMLNLVPNVITYVSSFLLNSVTDWANRGTSSGSM